MEIERTVQDASGANVRVCVLEYQEDASLVQLFTPGAHLAFDPRTARLLMAALSEAAMMAETNERELNGDDPFAPIPIPPRRAAEFWGNNGDGDSGMAQ